MLVQRLVQLNHLYMFIQTTEIVLLSLLCDNPIELLRKWLPALCKCLDRKEKGTVPHDGSVPMFLMHEVFALNEKF